MIQITSSLCLNSSFTQINFYLCVIYSSGPRFSHLYESLLRHFDCVGTKFCFRNTCQIEKKHNKIMTQIKNFYLLLLTCQSKLGFNDIIFCQHQNHMTFVWFSQVQLSLLTGKRNLSFTQLTTAAWVNTFVHTSAQTFQITKNDMTS